MDAAKPTREPLRSIKVTVAIPTEVVRAWSIIGALDIFIEMRE